MRPVANDLNGVCDRQQLPRPGGKFESTFEGGAGVHRLAVGDDYALERQLQQSAEGGQGTLLMRRRRPYAQLVSRRRQRVGKNDGALLGQPQRRLVSAASVVEGHEPAGKLTAGLDKLQIGLGDVLAKEEARAER